MTLIRCKVSRKKALTQPLLLTQDPGATIPRKSNPLLLRIFELAGDYVSLSILLSFAVYGLQALIFGATEDSGGRSTLHPWTDSHIEKALQMGGEGRALELQ